MAARFRFYCGNEEIGSSLLDMRDFGMGTATGVFVPGSGYEHVRSVFRLFSSAQTDAGPHDKELVARYYEARDKLDLRLTTPDGVEIPVSVVHISDFAEGPNDDSYEVEVHFDDRSVFVAFTQM